jgi:hypothetical protein
MSININIPPPTNFQPSNKCGTTAVTLQSGNTYLETTFIPRISKPEPGSTPLNTLGIPGTNFLNNGPSVPVFYQGEDIVIDIYFSTEGKCLDLNRYTMNTIVKSSQYLNTNNWNGTLDNGIYRDKDQDNHYIIFIPSSITDKILAGSFELDLWVVENVGNFNDIKPRTMLLGKTYFNLEYAAFSPHPETIENGVASLRTLLPNSYPPAFNTTVGGGQAPNNDDCLPWPNH